MSLVDFDLRAFLISQMSSCVFSGLATQEDVRSVLFEIASDDDLWAGLPGVLRVLQRRMPELTDESNIERHLEPGRQSWGGGRKNDEPA